MTGIYTDTPHNMAEIIPYVLTDKEAIMAGILGSQKCYFYDACSFRRHSKLNTHEAGYFLKYMKMQNGVMVITRCILMELASHSGVLNREYVDYIKYMNKFGITILVIYEEDIFSIMELCFGTNAAINSYLCWAVRALKAPVSTITETLKRNSGIHNEVIKGKNLDNQGVYKRFFKAVRENKESGDNLGEELLAVCLHILSHLPGEEDGTFCVVTDDKGAASKIDSLFKETAKHHRGKKMAIFSTPKLVQVLHREHILMDREHIKAILSMGMDGNIAVLGTRICDIRSILISIDSEELAHLILQQFR